MRAARSWCGDVVEPAELFPPWTSNEAFIRAIQRDAIESAAKEAARARQRDNDDAADECDACWRRIRALLPPAAEKPEGR